MIYYAEWRNGVSFSIELAASLQVENPRISVKQAPSHIQL